jgi:hypothetical protein
MAAGASGCRPADGGRTMRPAGGRPFPGAGSRAGRARRQRAAPRADAPGPALALAFPGHDARGIWGGACTMLARGGAPLSPPLQPPILSRKRGVLAPSAFLCGPNPPRSDWGVRAAARRLSRRSIATDGAGPGDSGFSRGHDAGRAGSAVLSRSAATRPAGGMAPAGAGVGGLMGKAMDARQPAELP